MTPSQADAIADAITQPDPQREQIAARQREQAQQLQRQRVAAGISLAGMAGGALIASLSGLPWLKGVLYGGVLTFCIAKVVLDRRALRR